MYYCEKSVHVICSSIAIYLIEYNIFASYFATLCHITLKSYLIENTDQLLSSVKPRVRE